ncbi:matrilin-4-like [Mytilus edulis]|uniref:matrilin-4-like n=1 Tax=Mytilus edulis TaxID=6550 RepID=UPI0039F04FC1
MGIGLKTICLVLVVILNQYKHTEARGPECLKCNTLDDPLSCTHVVRCGDHEQCFVLKYLTDDGHTFFDVGCKDNQACATINQVGKRANKEMDRSPFNQTFEDSFKPTVTCEECCQSDLCNVDSRCSSTHLQRAGRLLCYACDFLKDTQLCNTIKLCSDNELCFYEHTFDSGLSHERKWDSQCKKKIVCDQLPPTGQSKCCNTDICNSGRASSSKKIILYTIENCVSDPADIVFLLDESGSVGTRNFDIELQFIAEFAKHYTIGPNDVQMGVISFTTLVTEHFTLKDYANINDLTRGITSIHYHGGGTRTDLAIDYAVQRSFSPGSGARTSFQNNEELIQDRNENTTKYVIILQFQVPISSVIELSCGIRTDLTPFYDLCDLFLKTCDLTLIESKVQNTEKVLLTHIIWVDNAAGGLSVPRVNHQLSNQCFGIDMI